MTPFHHSKHKHSRTFVHPYVRRDSVVVGIFGNNDNIIISNIVIIRIFSIEIRCKYSITLISELCTLYGILLVIFITYGEIYMKH